MGKEIRKEIEKKKKNLNISRASGRGQGVVAGELSKVLNLKFKL